MRGIIYSLVVVMSVLSVSGCAENQTRIGEGAGIGGLLGATVGGIVGHQSGDGVAGALIGGAVGATGGALVGSQIEKPHAVDSDGVPMSKVTIKQIVEWTKQGLTGDSIIARINDSRSTYVLTSDDINYLRSQGVSERVIETMQSAR